MAAHVTQFLNDRFVVYGGIGETGSCRAAFAMFP